MSAVIKALAALLHAANDFAPEDDPDKYDAWRALVCAARGEHDRLRAELATARAEGLEEAARMLIDCWDDGEQGPPRAKIERYVEITLIRSKAAKLRALSSGTAQLERSAPSAPLDPTKGEP